MSRGPTLVDILKRTGLVDEPALQRARLRQERRGGSLLENLVLGGASEVDLARTLSSALRLPVVNLRGKRIDPEILALVPRAVAEKHACLPLFTKTELGVSTLFLGVEDPTDPAGVEDVARRFGGKVRPVVVGPVQLRAAIRSSYPAPEPGAVGAAPAETPVSEDDTAPVLVAPPPVPTAGNAPGASAREKPRDVPTRNILRALLQVLIEKEVITRAELLAAVDELRGPRHGNGASR